MASAFLKEEVAINPTTKPPEHRTGKQTLGGHKQNLVCTRTQKNGAVIPQETDPDLPMSVQSLQQRCGSVVACCRVRGTECSSACMDLLKEVTLSSLPPP